MRNPAAHFVRELIRSFFIGVFYGDLNQAAKRRVEVGFSHFDFLRVELRQVMV